MITATLAADANYNGAIAMYTLTIKNNDTLSFPSAGVTATFGDSMITNQAATAMSTRTGITYTSDTPTVATVVSDTGAITIVGAGMTTITATLAADANYNLATAMYTLTINKKDDTLSFPNADVMATFGDAVIANQTATAMSTRTGITYTSDTPAVAMVNPSNGAVTIVGSGSAIITATLAADANYNLVTAMYTLNVIAVRLDSVDDPTPGDADATVIFVTPPTDTPEAFVDAGYITRATYDAPDKTEMATNVNRERYKSTYDDGTTDDTDETVEIPNDATIATAVAGIQANAEYMRTSADEINAAYAYARGYSGAGIIVSNMGYPIGRSHAEISFQSVPGYTADGGETGVEAGSCSFPDVVCDPSKLDGTHLAGIIVGKLSNFGSQGIAYDARLKPIDIYTKAGTDVLVDNTKLRAAIGQASGSDITVMNNGWDVSGVGSHTDSSTPTFYRTANKVSTISDEEAAAWRDAVKTTVVVFGAGDYGHNKENGMVKLYTENTFDILHSPTEKAWNEIDSENRNIASSHARLPLEITELRGKWLTVIALTTDNRIWEESNGCGDAKNFCLGAPGVDVNSALDSSYGPRSGTAQAAAFVSGAVAVLKGAFPNLTPTQLVHRILDTADDLGIPGVDGIYGHGALNLAKATEPDTTAPTLSSAMTTSATSITLEMSESVYGTGITPGDFTIAGVASSPTVSAVADVSGRTITLTLSAAIAESDAAPTVSYTAGTPSITDALGNTLGNFGPQAITNNL